MISLYLDTADRAAAEPLLDLGIFRGVTTNPTILDRAGLTVAAIDELYRWAADRELEQIFFQAWGSSTAELVECGRRLHGLGPQVVVKISATRAGVAAASRLAAEGVTTLLTAVYNVSQAVLGAASGARYIAPYLGRIADLGRQAHDEVIGMHQVLRGLDAETEVLVASVRSPADIVALSQQGIGAYALPIAVADKLFGDPSTEAAAELFDRTAAGPASTATGTSAS